jgi:hypothetical protein
VKTHLILAAPLTLGGPCRRRRTASTNTCRRQQLPLRGNGVIIAVRLTPGVDIAANVIAGIDADHDSTFSKPQAQSYVEDVVRDLPLANDGRPAALRLQ